ncbi:MAG: sodium:proton antiporter [Bacteroidales bacterium]|nr:sodium:proton antiporter [Bacteroidales bacterium]
MAKRPLSRLIISLIPILTLVALLAVDISIFGSDAIYGASQVSLLFSAGICVWLAMWLFKVPWADFEVAIKGNVSDVTTAIVILFLIGSISGSWTMSGIVPTFIYYGIKIISPKVFLLTACVICALVSLMVGSSWTTIATIGVALMGIGKAEGFSEGIVAGAIISGAYFGDKISPLSDTTVLASSMNKVPLFEHIRYMLFTTVPSIIITLILFLIIGLAHPAADAATVSKYTDILGARFNLSPWLMVVPVLTAVMIARKMPALVVLGLSTILAAAAAVIFQPGIIHEIGAGLTDVAGWKVTFTGVAKTLYDTVALETGDMDVNQLVTSRGMTGMMNTVYLIICAMCFGAAMKASGMLKELASMIVPFTKRRSGLVASTVVTGTTLNGIVSDQYLSIILTSSIFKDIYEKEGYEGRLLSRAVEDSATVTSPLYPWSSCGMTQATILSVPTVVYLPFCFFNIISPLMSFIVALTGYKIVRSVRKEPQE